jgi:uncharacterized protein (DUF1697 family)
MIYVAFLRGVNVGGRSIVAMDAVKRALAAAGMKDIRTYINSGNVMFSTAASDARRLTTTVEEALALHTGMDIKVVVLEHAILQRLVDAIPPDWVDDETMRTYVLLLWKEVDGPAILERLPARAGVDELRYAPGAVIWRVDRENLTRSGMSKIVGTPLYKQLTVRSANTVRKLNALTVTSGAQTGVVRRAAMNRGS